MRRQKGKKGTSHVERTTTNKTIVIILTIINSMYSASRCISTSIRIHWSECPWSMWVVGVTPYFWHPARSECCLGSHGVKNGSWVSSGASVVQAGWSDLLWTYLTRGLVSFFPALKCDLSLSLKLVSKPDRTFRTFFYAASNQNPSFR